MLPIPKPGPKQRKHSKAKALLPTWPAPKPKSAPAPAAPAAAASAPRRSRSRSPARVGAGADGAKRSRSRSRSPRGVGDAKAESDAEANGKAAAEVEADADADAAAEGMPDVARLTAAGVEAVKNGWLQALAKCNGRLTRTGWGVSAKSEADAQADALRLEDAGAPDPLQTDAVQFNTACAFWRALFKPTAIPWKCKKSTAALTALCNRYSYAQRPAAAAAATPAPAPAGGAAAAAASAVAVASDAYTRVTNGAVILAAIATGFAPPELWSATEGTNPRHLRLSERELAAAQRQKWAKTAPPS